MDFLDKYLTVWILGAMAVGVGLGFVAPSVTRPIQEFHLVEIGLIAMMYPPLAKADHFQRSEAKAHDFSRGMKPTAVETLNIAPFVGCDAESEVRIRIPSWG